MRNEPHQRLGLDQRLGNSNGDRQSVRRARPAPELVDNDETVLRDVVQNERHRPHLAGESRHVGFDAVVRRHAREELPRDRERRVAGRHEAADQRHDSGQRNAADICALPAHVAARDDLEAVLLRGVDIVGDEAFGLEFLAQRVPPGFDGQSIRDLW